MLPEAKLDLLLVRHAALENELLSQVSADRYVQMTRELGGLNPIVDAVRNWRAVTTEIAGIDAMIADPATDAEMRAMAEAERPALEARNNELMQSIRVSTAAKGRDGRTQRHARSPGWHRRRRGLIVRWRSVSDVRALR